MTNIVTKVYRHIDIILYLNIRNSKNQGQLDFFARNKVIAINNAHLRSV